MADQAAALSFPDDYERVRLVAGGHTATRGRLAPPAPPLDPTVEGERILDEVRRAHEVDPPHPPGRIFDVVVALGALALLWPVFVVVTALIKLSSRGPVFFRQERIGLSGTTFECLKFRSMVIDADKKLAELLADPAHAKDFEEKFKLTNDPRITKVGWFLRKSNLDELPQLLNVVQGHMSIVGPRPIVVAEVPRYGRAMATVLRVRPGLTGMWQISGRNDLPYRERVELDTSYVHTKSVPRDIVICCKTAKNLVGEGAGAY